MWCVFLFIIVFFVVFFLLLLFFARKKKKKGEREERRRSVLNRHVMARWRRVVESQRTRNETARVSAKKISQPSLLSLTLGMASLAEETSGLAIDAQKKQQTMSITTTKMKGHRGPVLCLAATQKYMLSGSADKSVRLWDRKSNKCLKAMLLKDEVNSVAFHSRKDHLVYATCNNSIYMFDVKSNSSSMIQKYQSNTTSMQQQTR